MTPEPNKATIGLLLSGGLDSCILLGHLLEQGHRVQPLYVRSQLAWQCEELRAAQRFLAAVASPRLASLVLLDLPLADLYADHWSVTGAGVPDAASADDAVYLPGRNALLLLKPALWCRLHQIEQLALAVLASNPFSDATAEFFDEFESALARHRRPRADSPAVRQAGKTRGDGTWPPLAAGTDVFLHRAATRTALWPVQQVRRAESRLPYHLRRRSDRVRRYGRQAGAVAIFVRPCFTWRATVGCPFTTRPDPMFRVSREIDFCYGHRLLNYQGKCCHLHGHNGKALVTIETTGLDNRGMAIDFAEIKKVVSGWIDQQLDHRMILHRDDPAVPVLRKLGEPMFLMDVNPTAENIARLIFDVAAASGIPVVEVRLWETPNCAATYCGGSGISHS